MPTASHTARTAAPAMTPVPGLAGSRTTSEAPKWPMTGWAIVLPSSGTVDHAALAIFHGLFDRRRHFVRFAVAAADFAAAVADHDHAVEAESAAAFDHGSTAANANDFFVESRRESRESRRESR